MLAADQLIGVKMIEEASSGFSPATGTRQKGGSVLYAQPDKDEGTLARVERLYNWQSEILQLNTELLSTHSPALDATIDKALAKAGALTSSDRTYVFCIRSPDKLDNTHEWCASGIEPMIEMLQDLPIEIMDEWVPAFRNGDFVYIPSIADMPQGSELRETLEAQEIQSLLAMPMFRHKTLVGFVGYDSVRTKRSYTLAEIKLLESLANTISISLGYREAEARRKNAIAEIEQQRDRMAAVLSALPDLMLETDADGRFVGYHAGFGSGPIIESDSFLGRLIEDVLPPDVAATARAMMDELGNGKANPTQIVSMAIDGETHWYMVSAGSKAVSTGEAGFVFLIRDVSEQQRGLIELRQLGQIARLTSNPVVVTDAEKRITWVNPALEKRTGWTLDELRGLNAAEALQDYSHEDGTFALIDAEMQHNEPVRAEIPYLTRSGESYWASTDIQPLFDTDGELEGFLSVQTDITRIMQKHKEALELQLAAIDSANDSISILNSDGRYSYMNPAHHQMFGIPDDVDISTLDWKDQLALSDREYINSVVFVDLTTYRSWQGELKGQRIDGSTFDMEATLSLTPRNELVCVMRDITRRKQVDAERNLLRDELQLAERREAMAQVASAIAHDLNNLVAVIAGTVTLMEGNQQLAPSVRSDLQRINRATVAMEDLVARLGQLERKSSTREVLDMSEVMIGVVSLVETKVGNSCRLHTKLSSGNRKVTANRTEVMQALFNLTLNACEARNEVPTEVVLSLLSEQDPIPTRDPDVGCFAKDQSYVVFQVADNGIGVPDDIRSRLFERYMTTKGPKGTGLGLPIVATIVADNNAALWFESAEGEGTTVTIAWPTQNKTARQAPMPSILPREGRLADCNVLVVDDNIDFTEILSGIIEAEGGVAIATADPREAVELVREEPALWSAVVTDYDMPEVNGFQLAKSVQTIDPALPCILITAQPGLYPQERALFHSIHGKPLDQGVFLANVEASCAARRQTMPAQPSDAHK